MKKFIPALALSAIILVGALLATNNESKSEMFKYTNKLAAEKSPYLLQHAHNPVNWYPWGDEAFAKAAAEGKPIFLSIGYSTCHWCHVMEHESFEDEQVAKLMNESFVSIKVDREERPDIDNVYMTVCQMMTGSGGWPLTIIMTPDKKPFFAGTYIPKESRFGRMGLVELLPRVSDLWKNDRKKLLQSADEIVGHLSNSTSDQAGLELNRALLDRAYDDLAGRFDDQFGGFGNAPKFPTPHNFLFLMRHYQRTGDAKALQMLQKTLTMMHRGGLYDQIGFGFHRYSTDRQWLLPHFEKMIYDQAMLILAYSEAWQLTGNDEFARTAHEIITYVLRDMTSPEGGFYSAEDADSDGEEGKFYVWSQQEIDQLLGADAGWFSAFYNVAENGNFSDQASRQKSGGNILHRRHSVQDFAAGQNISPGALQAKLDAARQKLFAVREKRIHPHKDDKILTDWNGLMIAALAAAGRIFNEPKYTQAAEKSAAFIATKMAAPNGRLLHRFRDGEAAIRAYIDDYAFYTWGLIELFRTTQDAGYLERALALTEVLNADFGDENSGGFFTTPVDGEKLLIRNKEIYDGAIPSGNSVAMLNLIRLARITGRVEFEKQAQQIGAAFSKSVERSPSAYTFLMSALEFAVGPAFEIVIVGKKEAPETLSMMRALNDRYLPNSVLVLRDINDPQKIDALSPFVSGYEAIDGKATAYVCQEFACRLPTTSVEKMLQLLPAVPVRHPDSAHK